MTLLTLQSNPIGTSTGPISQVRKLRLKEVKQLPKATELVNGRVGL